MYTCATYVTVSLPTVLREAFHLFDVNPGILDTPTHKITPPSLPSILPFCRQNIPCLAPLSRILCLYMYVCLYVHYVCSVYVCTYAYVGRYLCVCACLV